MSYNGSGTFNINTTGQPVVAGTVISSSSFNSLTNDLATGLTTAITKDGQTTTTARITFAQGLTSSLVTDSSSVSTGSIITAGGLGVAKALYVGTTANFAGVVTLTAQPILSSLTASKPVFTDASKGLVSTGTLGADQGGTGVANNVAATVTSSGNFAFTRTLTGATNVTLPTTGTLATLAGTEILTNKTLTTPTISSLSSASATALTLQSSGTNGVIIDTSQNLQFNSGYGSVATAYGCRAWVNFNGTGTVAIRASGNVSSITDLATGTYTVNLTTAIVDANYAIQISTGFASGIREDILSVLYNDAPYTPTTTAYTIKFYRADTNVAVDSNYAMTSIFR